MLDRMHAVDDRAGCQEQAGLEERMRHQVEDARPIGAHAHADEHEPKLADRAVGQHLLDVVLEKADGSGEQRRGCTHDRHHTAGVRRHREQENEPGNHVHARSHHRGRMNERRHRCGARHRIGQPHIQRDLRLLPVAPMKKPKHASVIRLMPNRVLSCRPLRKGCAPLASRINS